MVLTKQQHRRWNERMRFIRVDASCSAYETALGWLQRYPAAEVERRLIEIIEAKRKVLRGEVKP